MQFWDQLLPHQTGRCEVLFQWVPGDSAVLLQHIHPFKLCQWTWWCLSHLLWVSGPEHCNTIIHFVYCFSIAVTSHLWSNPYNGMVRLTGGNFISEGLVEVYCNGQWGTVCGFSSIDVDTVCKQLGYSEAMSYDHLTSLWVNNNEVHGLL